MSKTNEKVLAIDIGAASLKMCEFDYTLDGGMCMTAYTYHEYEEIKPDTQRSKELAIALDGILRHGEYEAKKVILGLSGAFAFYRFVKLPPIEDQERIRQMVEYEVRQNLPFPLEEVTWDYQLFQRPESGELEAVLIMVRTEFLEDFINVIEKNGLEVVLTEVSAVSTYNMARSNFIGEEQCEIIVDIGGYNTNLIFLDGNQFFIRSLPVSGHTITQQIAKEFDVPLEQAEEMKRLHGFVNLGGNYAETTSEVANKISKLVRNTMTRLHSEIVRSINLYRSAQQGNKPVKLYLTGGSSTMEYTERFFQEKLGMDVDYLNPFQSIMIDEERVDVAALQEVAHMFSAVIGLGMRYNVECPVELKLIPESQRREADFIKRKPWLLAAAGVLVLAFGMNYTGHLIRYNQYRNENQKLKKALVETNQTAEYIKNAIEEIEKGKNKFIALQAPIKQRHIWGQLYSDLLTILPNYVWIDSIRPIYDDKVQTGNTLESVTDKSKAKTSAHIDKYEKLIGFDVELHMIEINEKVPGSKSKYGNFKRSGALYDEFKSLIAKAGADEKNIFSSEFKANLEGVRANTSGDANNVFRYELSLNLKQPIFVPAYASDQLKKIAETKNSTETKKKGWM